MALRRAIAQLAPRLLQQEVAAGAMCSQRMQSMLLQQDTKQDASTGFSLPFRSFASDAVVSKAADSSVMNASQLSLSPSSKITYNELNHVRYEPVPVGSESRPFAYFVQTGGRFLYASAIRLAVLKGLVSLSAAADTLALSSLEVDLSGLEEGSTITVKWRGKPVFIKHRSEDDIATQVAVPLSDLPDPQADVDRAVNPKYLVLVGICTHLGCVPLAGAGNYQGWFCPCHGSHYDGSGRIREGPAPYNLEVPEYKFMDDKKIVIG